MVGVTSFRGAIGREPTGEEMARLMALRLRYLPEEVATRPATGCCPASRRSSTVWRATGGCAG